MIDYHGEDEMPATETTTRHDPRPQVQAAFRKFDEEQAARIKERAMVEITPRNPGVMGSITGVNFEVRDSEQVKELRAKLEVARETLRQIAESPLRFESPLLREFAEQGLRNSK